MIWGYTFRKPGNFKMDKRYCPPSSFWWGGIRCADHVNVPLRGPVHGTCARLYMGPVLTDGAKGLRECVPPGTLTSQLLGTLASATLSNAPLALAVATSPDPFWPGRGFSSRSVGRFGGFSGCDASPSTLPESSNDQKILVAFVIDPVGRSR